MKPWPNVMMEVAHTIAQRSTCAKHHVGAVITTENNRILGVGYNGALPGKYHCIQELQEILDNSQWNHPNYYDITNTNPREYQDNVKQIIIDQWHSEWSEKNEIHAEVNCCVNCLKNGIALDNAIMYVTLSPCINCAKVIAASGIKTLYYDGPDRSDKNDDGIDFLTRTKIDVIHI
jgi:deoxycytidylate deaminase